MLTSLLFLSVCFLAYANGANDNIKGVASLFGRDTAGFRQALAWSTLTTFAGSIALSWLLTLPCAAISAAVIYYAAINTSQ